LGINIKS